MNDFERFLETELRVMLDPVVARKPPVRRGPREAVVISPVIPAPEALAVETIPVVEPAVVVPIPVASARAL